MIKELSPTKGKNILPSMIAEGEHERQDFKYAISDGRKIARSISAFANHEGGRLLIGVKDDGTIAGVKSDEDIYLVEYAAHGFCVPPQEIDIEAYQFEGLVVYVVNIPKNDKDRPVKVKESDSKSIAYYRVADENITAHPLMVRTWLTLRKTPDRSAFISDLDKKIMELIYQRSITGDYLPLDEIYTHFKVSRNSIGNSITNLYQLKIIDFEYVNRTFVVKSIGESQS